MSRVPSVTTNQNGLVALSRNIDSLVNEIASCERDINSYANDGSSFNIEHIIEKCRRLSDSSLKISDEIHTFEHHTRREVINDINATTVELQNLFLELDDINFKLCTLDQILECDEKLKQYREIKANGESNLAILKLSSITELLNNLTDGSERLDIFKPLNSDVSLHWEETLNELSKLWNDYLCVSESSSDENKIVSVRIRDYDNDRKNTLFEALILSNRIHIEIKKFSSFVFRNMLDPLVRFTAKVNISKQDNECLIIEYLPNKKYKPQYEHVLNNLKLVFDFLCLKLKYDKHDQFSMIRLIGDFISQDFSDTLIKDCLVHTIPNCVSELQDYGKVTSQVELFQKYLMSINFFENENVSILHYANNIDVLFANKTTQYFLENARNIMKKDLGNIMSVGCESKKNEEDDKNLCNLESDDKEIVQYFFQSFETSPFCFPRCAISRSVQELLDLVVLMMEQAINASDLCARRLYYTARNVFELYMAIVPLHHKKLLETIPQQIALFHNNCMYLAHHLLSLGPKWQSCFANNDLNYTIIFSDQVKELRDLATHMLLTHMRTQRKQLLDTIRSSDLYYIAIKDTLSENAEQAIRQCIRQLQVLKTVWSGIFPLDVYRRLISCLANVFIEELISKVVVQEDITADVATQLTDLYKIVLNRLPQIYDENTVIHKNIHAWLKFNELILILGGNLATIEERWFNGTGPLALQFKPDEVKQLIRALFQNTTFRANLLSKIK